MKYFDFKAKLEDFIVEEVLKDSLLQEKGKYLYCFVQRKNKTTQEVVELITKNLNIPRKYIGIAGLKDKRALSRQRICIATQDLDKTKTSIKAFVQWLNTQVKVLELAYASQPLHMGDNLWNRFILRLRSTEKLDSEQFPHFFTQAYEAIKEKGFPNLFGEQRFGFTKQNRKIWADLLFGNIIRMKREMNTPEEKRFKVQSFVSYIFNHYTTERLKKFWPKPIEGDLVQSDKITGPVFGNDLKTPVKNSPSYEFEQTIFQHFGIKAEHAKTCHQYGLRGLRRPIICQPENCKLRFDKSTGDAIVSFFLPAGSYASTFFEHLDFLIEKEIQKSRKTID